jgi:hypothetical protein
MGVHIKILIISYLSFFEGESVRFVHLFDLIEKYFPDLFSPKVVYRVYNMYTLGTRHVYTGHLHVYTFARHVH